MVAIDTLKLARRLREGAGFTPEHAEAVAGEVGPDYAGGAEGAEVIELGARNGEVVKGAFELSHVELGVVGDYEVGAGEAFDDLRGDAGEFRFVANVAPFDAVALNEILAEEPVSFRWAHEPVPGFHQFAVVKDGDTGGADACVR